jgi:hypothetical protein
LRRSIAYSRPVVLQSDQSVLRILPIQRGDEGELCAPFEFRQDGPLTEGGILLIGKRDPLPVRLEAVTPEPVSRGAWAAALLGFSAATCFSNDAPRSRSVRASPRRRTLGERAGQSIFDQRLVVPRRRFWPTHLEPVGSWAAHGASFVPGHRAA